MPRLLCAPGMELVYRGQDFQGKSVRVFSGCAQRLEYLCGEVAATVVLIHQLVIAILAHTSRLF